MTTVLITGAGGRIGRIAAPHLAGQGLTVIRAGRDGRDGERALGDLATASVDALAAMLSGVDVVIHLAGVAHRAADPALVTAVNRDGAARLASAARIAGVRRFVFASTIYAASRPGRATPFTAETCDPPHGAYGEAKRQAEAEIAAAYAGELLILRFAPVLIGPPAGGLGRLLALCRTLAPLPFGSLRNRRSLASPATVLETLACAALRGEGVAPVADAITVSAADIVTSFRRAAGRGPGLTPLPAGLVRLLAKLAGGEDIAATLCDDFVIDTQAIAALGVRPSSDTLAALEAYAS